MGFTSCICPNCNAQFEYTDKIDVVRCSYCGTQIIKENVVNLDVDVSELRDADWYYETIIELHNQEKDDLAKKICDEFEFKYPLDPRVDECREYPSKYAKVLIHTLVESSGLKLEYKSYDLTSTSTFYDEEINKLKDNLNTARKIKEEISNYPESRKRKSIKRINKFIKYTKECIEESYIRKQQYEEEKEKERESNQELGVVLVLFILFWIFMIGCIIKGMFHI